MIFLNKRTTCSTGELWIFKWGIFTAGILAELYLSSCLDAHKALPWLMSLVCCALAAYFRFNKSKR